MAPEKLPLSVIIPTMNRLNSLKATINSINSCKKIPSEIIIIDQSKSFQKNKVKLINEVSENNIVYLSQREPSLTKARNLGINTAKNEIIVFSDDDIEVENCTLFNIYSIFSKQNDISLIGGLDSLSSLTPKSHFESFCGYLFLKKNFFKKNMGHVTQSIFGRFPQKIVSEMETEWAMGFFFALRKSLAQNWKIKFDENLISYAYPEDLDFTHRYYLKSKQESFRMIFTPKVRVKHLCSSEYRIPSFKATLMFVIHRRYLSYKIYNTFFSNLAVTWSNLGEFFRRVSKKHFSEALDILKAEVIYLKNRNELKSGRIPLSIKEIFKNN